MNFRFHLWLVLLLVAKLQIAQAVAEHPTIPIENSLSPDGSKDLVIVESDRDDANADGTTKIREVATGKILGTFHWSGFGPHVTDEAFAVLWRPDSRAFAINWEVTRGFSTCEIYLQSKFGWVRVKLPDFSRHTLALMKRTDRSEDGIPKNWGGHGHETVLTWLPGSHLRVETNYRGLSAIDAKGKLHDFCWFTLEIPSASSEVKPKAIIETFRFAPASAEPWNAE